MLIADRENVLFVVYFWNLHAPLYIIKVFNIILQGKQGIVKHIYRGIVFLYDESEEENGGYFTSKSNVCEKVKLTVGDCSGKVCKLFFPASC